VNVKPDRWLLTLVGAVTVAYLAFAAHAMDRLDPLTGDEPFYVMTAISIIRDGDLDEANNYANRDYDEFYPPDPVPSDWNGWPSFPRTLPPHPATTDLDELHTKHGIGLSLLIAIPYELAGRAGSVAVILVCAVLVTVNMYLLARDARAPSHWAALIAGMLALAMPIAPYAALIFPEVPAALLLIYAVRRLAAVDNSRLTWVLTGASIGFLPWLHQRFVPTVIVLVAVVLWRVWPTRDIPLAALALAPIAAGGFALVGYNYWLYDSPVQSTADHAGFNGLTGTLNATFGLLLDAQWGLLVAAPIYLIAIAGVPSWLRTSSTARLALIALAPYLVVIATYRVWWGEWGPPARYLVPVAPFAAGALAAVIGRLSKSGRIAVIGVWCVGMLLTLIGAADPQRFYHHPNGDNHLVGVVDSRIGTDLADRLVAFQPLAQSSLAQRSVAAIVLIVVLVIVVGAIESSARKTTR
jgi:hypothetical protein